MQCMGKLFIQGVDFLNLLLSIRCVGCCHACISPLKLLVSTNCQPQNQGCLPLSASAGDFQQFVTSRSAFGIASCIQSPELTFDEVVSVNAFGHSHNVTDFAPWQMSSRTHCLPNKGDMSQSLLFLSIDRLQKTCRLLFYSSGDTGQPVCS